MNVLFTTAESRVKSQNSQLDKRLPLAVADEGKAVERGEEERHDAEGGWRMDQYQTRKRRESIRNKCLYLLASVSRHLPTRALPVRRPLLIRLGEIQISSATGS